MPSSVVDANSLIVLDIGSAHTRVAYFDVVDSRYRFIGMGQAPTTLAAPARDVGIGLMQAMQNLQDLVGRQFVSNEGGLIMPSQPDGTGVDALVATMSAGPTLKTAVVGLLNEISLASVQRLARTSYNRVVETIGINDPRHADEQIDSLLKLGPDLIIIAGGTEDGATKSMHKLVEVIGVACYLTPADRRPSILYAGNSAIAQDVSELLGAVSPTVRVSPNIRPTLETEDSVPAQRELADIFLQIRQQRIPGIEQIYQWSDGHMLPNAYALGRMTRFLARVFDSGRGALSVDLGASAATIAAVFYDRLSLNVFPQFGLGESLAGLLRHVSVEDIIQWLPVDVSAATVRDYIFQKALRPHTIPATQEDLFIEQALARVMLQHAIRQASAGFPPAIFSIPGQLPPFEPIFVSGSIFTKAPNQGQALLMLLDSLQPTGMTTIFMDQNHLLPALGVAAEYNNILPIQVVESGALGSLANVIAPISNAPIGTPILKVRVVYADGHEAKAELKQGNLEILPLMPGQTAHMELTPLKRVDLGYGPGRRLEIDITGSALGIVFDARGRPLRLPQDDGARRELLKKWHRLVGG
jgi:uncharacterized protein (TIGR01319 family)